jgi:hypothetical protein
VTPTLQPIPERVEQFLSDAFTLDRGGHDNFDDGHCATEAAAWLTDEEHSDHPQCMSPVLAAFLRRMNDRLGDEERQLLKPYIVKAIGTRGDGYDQVRGYMAADWAVRTAAPFWLELMGQTEPAEQLRGLAPIVDPASARTARENTRSLRSKLWQLRNDKLEGIRTAVREQVKAELEKRGPGAAGAADAADAAGAAVAAGAADAADAAGAAVAAVAADAADAAVAAVAADAADAADAAVAADAADAAVAADAAGYWKVYDAVYKAVRGKLYDRFRAVIEEKYPESKGFLPTTLEFLDRLIDPAAEQAEAA